RKALLHLLEEMQDRVAVVRQLHLGIEVDVDVKVVRVTDIAIHPRGPEFVARRPAPRLDRRQVGRPRPGASGVGGVTASLKRTILPHPDRWRYESTALPNFPRLTNTGRPAAPSSHLLDDSDHDSRHPTPATRRSIHAAMHGSSAVRSGPRWFPGVESGS